MRIQNNNVSVRTIVAMLGSLVLVACSESPAPAADVAATAASSDAATARELPPNPDPEGREYSPYGGRDLPDEVYFGDTHLHSSWSTDAGMAGATLGPDEAYRVARGETVTSHEGWQVQLIRPLDFLVLADHAENLGLADFVRRSDPRLLANETGRRWHDLNKAGDGYQAFLEWLREDTDQIADPMLMAAAWDGVTANADAYNEPGLFTAFHGFEWTQHGNGNNLHRVVVFRDGIERTSQVMPFSSYDSPDAEDLWAYLGDYEALTGGQAMAIPHNGNLSNGLMFDTVTFEGEPLTRAYAETRSQFEPLIEVTQMKGDGEAHPLLSPNDEFADFETMDAGNITGSVAKTPEMLPGEYARSAMLRGLELEAELGVNPYQFGMIGSTDAHTGIPSSREDNNFSKAHIAEPSPTRYEHALIEGIIPEASIMVADVGAAGLAAVWATENTREAIWDAMERREVYATTGSRLRVRVFGGWGFVAGDEHASDLAAVGYGGGVPMGGALSAAPDGTAPSFVVYAQRDPDGANLDRVQVIKGWLDADGETHERIYDVACSDDRRIEGRGCNGVVGSTVDLSVPSYTNSIGDPVLAAHWEDPDFDPSERAFYYVRVIEIPIPRWTAYDAAFFDLDMPDDIAMTVQDRAYTSAIWYTP